MNWKQLYAKKAVVTERLKKICPRITNDSGIYFYTRSDENGNFAYIGKAKHLIDRNVQHILGYEQRIDISIKKRGFEAENGTGWKFNVLFVPNEMLDQQESFYIKRYMELGYTMYNKESGGTVGKTLINERKPAKTYADGLKCGENRIKKQLRELIDKYLVIVPKNDKKLAKNAVIKFYKILGGENDTATEDNCTHVDEGQDKPKASD